MFKNKSVIFIVIVLYVFYTDSAFHKFFKNHSKINTNIAMVTQFGPLILITFIITRAMFHVHQIISCNIIASYVNLFCLSSSARLGQIKVRWL